MKQNQFTLFFNLLVIFSFAFIIGCGAAKEGKETEIKKPAVVTDKLEYKLEMGKEYKYSLSTDSKTTITMMGQEQIVNSKMYALVILKPDAVLPDGNYSVIMLSDSLKLESDSPQMPDVSGELAKMNGKKYKSIVHKNGTVTDIEQIEQFELSETAKAIVSEMDPKGRFKNLLLEVPDKTLNVGDTWSETKNDSISRMGGKVFTKTTNDYKVTGKENIAGNNIYKINMATKIEMSGTGSQMGNEFTISGKGKATADYNFSKEEGVLLGYKVDQALDMSIDISQMGMTMPMTIITTTDAKLVK